MSMEENMGGPRQRHVGGSGLAVGLVVDNLDPENQGRVKVSFPYWGETRVSDWCRVASLLAGLDRGGWFIPEVGDEVVVGFHLGDTNRPIVLGSLWNSERRPPEISETINIRKIKTLMGHEIIFEDMPETSQISISTATGIQIKMQDDEQSVTIGYEEDPTTSITMSPEQGISLTVGPNKISVALEGGITITSGEMVKLVGDSIALVGTEVSIEATNLSIDAAAAIELTAEGIVEIAGALLKLN